MRKRSINVLPLLVALVMVFTLVLGCASPAAPSPTAAPSGAPAAAPTSAPAAAPTTAAAAKPTAAAAALAAVAVAKKPSGTVTVGIGDLEGRFGTLQNAATYGMIMLANVQEFLIYVGKDGKLIPGLATSWEMSKDGLTVTFHLRKGVQFHDGYGEMTSNDVKFTADLLQAKEARSHAASYFQGYIASVAAPDPYTAVFTMKKPAFDIFTRLSNQLPYFTVSSKAYVDKVGLKGADERWIGTGPWKFVEYQDGNYAKFEAVENSWRGTPEFQYLVVKQVPDAATRVMMLKAGDIDATDVTLQAVQDLEKSGFKVLTSPGLPFWMNYGGMHLPTKETFRKDIPWAADPADQAASEKAKKVRLALAMAIDKQAILDTIFHGKGVLTAVPAMIPIMPGYDPKWKPYPYDPAGAKKLLAEAGYPNGFSTQMYLYSLPGRDELQDVGIAQADMLGKIGIKVETVKQDYTAVFSPAMVKRQVYGLYNYAYTYPEAISMWDQNGRSNTQKMWFAESTEFDKMIADAIGTLDYNERAKKQTAIGQWMIDNVWGMAYATKDSTFAINTKKVKDWQLVPQQAYPHQFEYLSKAQ